MKKLLLIAVMAGCMQGYAQKKDYTPPVDTTTNKITYQEVIQNQSKKEILYDKALAWIATAFNNGNDVVQFKDRDSGKIICKFIVDPNVLSPGHVTATLTLLFKDDKYKYVATDFVYTGGNGGFKSWDFAIDEYKPTSVGMIKSAQKRIKQNTYPQVIQLLDNLKSYMKVQLAQDNF